MMKFSALDSICGGRISMQSADREITDLVIDSRKSIARDGALFFAIAGERHDGHRFLPELYLAGFRQFVTERPVDIRDYPLGNFLQVDSSLMALQDLVSYHRQHFSIPVIGIAGSNAKTIVKEWLYQLLSGDYSIVKNPGSYNSQVGVPLSVWQMQEHHQLGIFEAGISKPGEMKRLQQIVRPTLVIFTNIGPAHDEGFENRTQKIREKLLFALDADAIVYNKDQSDIAHEIENLGNGHQRLLSWGTEPAATVQIRRDGNDAHRITWNKEDFSIKFPFSDIASIENASHCVTTLLYLGCSPEQIQERIAQLRAVPMRLELKQGINHCQVVDDTYNNDLAGLQIGLDFLAGLQKRNSTLILSDILQSGLEDGVLVEGISELVKKAGVNSFVGIGPILSAQRNLFEGLGETRFFIGTEDFLSQTDLNAFQNEVILVKGARHFQFERIVQLLLRKIHGTSMEIDLGAMVHNLNFFRSRLKPKVKLMVMVKALAYGSGSEQVANLLQYHNIDYLGVAYPDEGVELRRNKIRLPIMVMNPSEESFATLMAHRLEPEIYSLSILKSFVFFLHGRPCSIHLKMDTGMHRLGFEEEELSEAVAILKANPTIKIASIFSHLAGADEAMHDDFTRQQVNRFHAMSSWFTQKLEINPILHILNSSGILRFPDLQLGMVRLGIGLYGVDPTGRKDSPLEPVATLKTIISQIKKVQAGESIGYGRRGRAEKEMTIATLAIGYADGFSRRFSQGVGAVLIRGKRAPVIGNVCMDMTMVDISEIDAKEGDEAIIFGKELPIAELARKIDTIPYEVLTSTSERVKRIFYAESI